MTSESSSGSGSDHSDRSSIYWGSDDLASSEPIEFRPHHYHVPNPPRLSSPRLFQDFFSSTARPDARLPPVPSRNLDARPHDFPQAFENVNRAVQTAHQAFQSNQVVDLTNSPPRYPPSPRTSMSRRRNRVDTSAYEYSSSPPALSRTSSLRPGQPSELSTTRSALLSRVESPAQGPARKRRRVVHEIEDTEGEEEEAVQTAVRQQVEAVDLTEVNNATDLSKALSKQRQDAIQAQMKQNQGSEPVGRTPLTSYKCPICMDTPENATTTICGHLFCHKCIIDTLRWSEEQRQEEYINVRVKGTCPVCRKPLIRNDKTGAGRTLIPLELKLIKRKDYDLKGKGVARHESEAPKKGGGKAKEERESSTEMWNELTAL